ncbi:hypothetical protein K488DRAFT_74697 [Vararia minispora EC-137]|uniref:Uncharacterized protein n=1 Tax=Vararia minispora EC-137 TaxID=1314806 RepID=A0ACB8Q6E7_9AGAM|nr:hypothetical protein K488DRAFT_74697 [Vararia minispora EC-137]
MLSRVEGDGTSKEVSPQKKHKVIEKKRGLLSQKHYEGFMSTNLAFICHLSTICVPHPHYMIGPTDKLLPTLLQHVQLTRSDPTIVRFTRKQWQKILSGEYWKEKWPAEEQGSFTMTGRFWKYGGREIFGKEQSDCIRAGWLHCSCKATVEKVTMDPYLIASVVSGLEQWVFIYQLTALVQVKLKEHACPVVWDGKIKHYMDFFLGDGWDQGDRTSMVKHMKMITFGEEGIKSRTGWAEDAWSGPAEVNLGKWCKWLQTLLRFFIFVADAECNKVIDKLGWTTIAKLSHKLTLILSMDHDHMDNLEQELTNRYFLMCLMVGDWPAEILKQQVCTNFTVMCMNHRTVEVDNLDNLYDKDDKDKD